MSGCSRLNDKMEKTLFKVLLVWPCCNDKVSLLRGRARNLLPFWLILGFWHLNA